MMYVKENSLKSQAIKLRTSGMTFLEINKQLGKTIPKSTLSTWFKNISLTSEQKKILMSNMAEKIKRSHLAAQQTNKRNRLIYLQNLTSKNIHLLKLLNLDIQKLLLSILYLGEGAKSKSTAFLSLANSNPKVIKLYLFLLNNCFHTDKSKFRVRIQCRADQDIKTLKKFWQKITGISDKQFYPTYIDKRTINKPTLKKEYKGVCAVHYFDRSIQLELELLSESVIKYALKGP